jgi:hypothetical protein
MRQAFAIFGMVFIFSTGAAAQEHPAIERLLTSTYFTLAPTSDAPSPALPLAAAPSTFSSTSATPASSATAAPAPGPFAFAANAPLAAAPADPPQYVQNVHETYSWQAYFGYTFFRFYEVPGTQQDTNGFNYSMVYYWKDWFGLDGEFAATQTSQAAFNGWFLFGGGGPRFRWSGPRGLELWGHVLFGYSHLTPQTSFGTQSAFAYEAGGGADINILRTRWALRFGADMVGSHYFNSYQYSPKAFGGIVYKF